MKNKNIFLKIYIVFVIILTISIIVLSILGKKERIGYLSDFEINVDNTLKINGLDKEENKELFINLEYDSITNYIFTNDSITNYSYNFRIKYYSKVFRHSDIYGVYPNINKILENNNYIRKLEMGKNGSPFGGLVSDKIINFEKIDNISYKLSLKNSLIFVYSVLLIILLICIKNTIYNLISRINITLIKNKMLISKISIVIIAIIIVSIVLLSFLGKKDRIGYLSEFKINIDNTLKINGLNNVEETEKLFTIDNKLDKTAISNYIFTNISITNYSYDFRIKYYSRIFKNNIIYGVYPSLDNLPNYIISSTMNDRFGTSFGSLISTKELKYDDKVDTKYYLIINFDVFYYIAIIFIVILLCTGFYLLQEYWKYKKTLDEKDYLFINKIELIGILLFAFQYWLFYPGLFQGFDTWRSIVHGLYNMSYNWDPVLLDLSVRFIDKLGLTMSVFLFINLFLWYSSITLIIISIYLKFKNKLIILLFSISFVLQIFFYNIEYLKDSTSTLYVVFSYSIIFSIILLPLKNSNKIILKIVSLLSLIIGMLHRHNFIVTVYPILIWFTYDYLKTKNIKSIKKYLFSFASIMFINAIILMGIYFIFPRIFIKNINKSATFHMFNAQIAACLVPSNDSSLIPENWWGENKSFKDLVEQYNKSPLNGDPIMNEGIFIFKYQYDNIKDVWIKSILKHPLNYIKHLLNYTKHVWTYKYRYISLENYYPNNDVLKSRNVYEDFLNTKFYKENHGIKFTELKRSIVDFIISILPNINVFLFILISIILFFISGLLLLLKKEFRNSILVFTFSTAFSSFATAIIVVVFNSNIHNYRYIYSLIPISIISTISFIIFIYNVIQYKKLRNNN